MLNEPNEVEVGIGIITVSFAVSDLNFASQRVIIDNSVVYCNSKDDDVLPKKEAVKVSPRAGVVIGKDEKDGSISVHDLKASC